MPGIGSTDGNSNTRPSPRDVVVAVFGMDKAEGEFDTALETQQQQQQHQHQVAIPLGSSSESSSDSDTVNSLRITKKKKSNDSSSILTMSEVRQRRSYLMNTLSRWENSEDSKNNEYSSTPVPIQQHVNTGTARPASTSPTYAQTLVISIASMCLVSLCTTMVWMFQVPNHSASQNYVHHLMPFYETSTTTTSRSSSMSSSYRPPPLLFVGGGAKFYIDNNRRLETLVSDPSQNDPGQNGQDFSEIDHPQYNTHPRKVITFRNIAQRGSTNDKIYSNRQSNHVGITSLGEVDANMVSSVFEPKTIQQEYLAALSSSSSSDINLNLETGRATRFPSVDQRVRVYMSNWYLPPCPSDQEAFVEYNYRRFDEKGLEYMVFREVRTQREKKRGALRTFIIDDTTNFDVLRHLNHDTMLRCTKSSYCKDFVKYLYPAMERAANSTTATSTDSIDVRNNDNNVLMYQFSDVEKTRAYNAGKGLIAGYPNVPSLKKFRYALSKEEREKVLTSNSNDKNSNCVESPRPIPTTILQQQMLDEGETKIIPVSQPIIMKLKIQRHYGYVEKIPDMDIDWSQKKNQAIFRGQFTGKFPVGMDSNVVKDLPVQEQCNLFHRCRLVYNAALNTKLVDAKLALPVLEARKDFPQVINNVPLYGDRVSIEDMLTFKALIMLEGNDVSSGLKWALYSNSVVMTQTPTKTSWAMEELLEPWVHYVPLSDDLSDVEEKMQWIIDHDEEAQRIAYRGKLWIHDLVFHPDAPKDEELVFDEILRRTKAHYMRNPNLEVPMVNIDVE